MKCLTFIFHLQGHKIKKNSLSIPLSENFLLKYHIKTGTNDLKYFTVY